MSELLKRIAAEHKWQLEDDAVSGIFGSFPITVLPGNGFISVFFYCPRLLQATKERLDNWLELNGRAVGFDSSDYSDDFYLVRLLNRGFRRASVDKVDQLIFVFCNMLREDSSAEPYICAHCGERCTEPGFVDGLHCYVHAACPVEGERRNSNG